VYIGEKVAIENICSSVFFMHVFNNVFIKVKKRYLYVFYLQINVSNIYDFAEVINKNSFEHRQV